MDYDLENTSMVLNSLLNFSVVNSTQPTLPVGFLSVIFTLRSIGSILAIAGNGLTIAAVVKFSSLQKSTNYFVASLAVADFIQGLLTPGVILHHVLANHPSFIPICMIEKTFSSISVRGNYINTLWIAIDRLFYIAYPLRYPLWMTNTKTIVLITLTWVYLGVETPLLMYFAGSLKQGGICKISLIVSSTIYNRYWLPQFLACLLMMVLCYIIIAIIANKQARAIAALHQPFETLEVSIFRRQLKIAKMMFLVLASYLLSNIPQYVLSRVIQNKATQLSLAVEKVTTTIYFMNSFLNPIIYAWKSKEFRGVFRKMMGINNSVVPGGSHET